LASTSKVKPIWILMKQEMTGWHWHQLYYMQIICMSLKHLNAARKSIFTGRMLNE